MPWIQCETRTRPGAGQRPPELAGRDKELAQFEVVLERVARGRPERSMVLTGLRGVGKTVLLNAFRSMAMQRLWGTGKIEARPDQSIRRPIGGALHMAVRELAPRHRAPERIDDFLGVLKAFLARDPEAAKGASGAEPARHRRADGAGAGRTPATWRSTSPSCSTDAAAVAADLGVGIALFIDEMQDMPAPDVSALCAACHELSQNGGAADRRRRRPAAPARRCCRRARATPSGCSAMCRIDRLDRDAADLALLAPAQARGRRLRPGALDALYAAADGYPYFVQAYGKVTWDVAAPSPVTAGDVEVAAPLAAGRTRRRVLRQPVRARHPGRARVHARDGAARRRAGADRAGRRRTRPQAVERVARPGTA